MYAGRQTLLDTAVMVFRALIDLLHCNALLHLLLVSVLAVSTPSTIFYELQSQIIVSAQDVIKLDVISDALLQNAFYAINLHPRHYLH